MPILNMVSGGSNKKKFYCVIISDTQPISPVDNMIWIQSNILCQNIKLIDDVKNATTLNTMHLVVSDELVDIDLSEVSKLYNTDFQSFKINKSNLNKTISESHFKLKQWGYISTYAIPLNVVYVDSMGNKTDLEASIFRKGTWYKFTNKNLLLINYTDKTAKSKLAIFNNLTISVVKEIDFFGYRINNLDKKIAATDQAKYKEYDYNLNLITDTNLNLNLTIPPQSYLIDYKEDCYYVAASDQRFYKYRISDKSMISNVFCPWATGVTTLKDIGVYIVVTYPSGFAIYEKTTLNQIAAGVTLGNQCCNIKTNLIYSILNTGDEFQSWVESNVYDVQQRKVIFTKKNESFVGTAIDENNYVYTRVGNDIKKYTLAGTAISTIKIPSNYGTLTAIDIDTKGSILLQFAYKIICISSVTGQEVYNIDLSKYYTNMDLTRPITITNLNK